VIYVALPVHDEQHTIGPLLWKIRSMFAELGRDFHILVVDDGSKDRTAEVLDPYRRVLPLTVLRNERRQGYAASLERLIREAVRVTHYPRRDGLLTLEADFSHPPSMIPGMVRSFQGGADLVAGRIEGLNRAPRPVRIARFGSGILARALSPAESEEDPLCGFRLYRLSVLRNILRELPSQDARLLRHEGWAANAELLAAVRPHVRRSEQVNVALDYSRRYRTSRFRALPQLWGLLRAGRDPRLREANRRSG